jgi:hypothetical protein
MSTLVTTCEPCAHIAQDGWHGLPEGAGHCRDCHAVYSGRQAHCVRCHQTFGGDEAATRHLDRSGSCVDPASVLHSVSKRRILTQNGAGVWIRAFGQ